MGMYLGDYAKNSTVCFCWDSFNKNGASVTRTSNGSIKIYRDDSVAESTAGITDVEDFDDLTGIHSCKINTAADSFYAAGHDYSVVLAGATIDGEDVNAVLAVFSVENRLSAGELFRKAAKVLVNKAVQNKLTGAINYYDNDGVTVILTHTPNDSQDSISRISS